MTTPTRTAGLDALRAFVPHAGADYRRDRNHDTGPARTNVSGLSPYIRHRLVTEQEVVDAVLERHNLHTAEKFVQEVSGAPTGRGGSSSVPRSGAVTAKRSVTCSPATCPRTTRTWSPGGPGSRRWTRGGVSSSRPGTCTTTRGCGSRVSGSSPRADLAARCRLLFRHLLDVTPPPTPCRGAGSPVCRPGGRRTWRRRRTSRATRTAVSRRPASRPRPSARRGALPAAVRCRRTTSTAASASASGCCCTRRTWSPRACSRSTRPCFVDPRSRRCPDPAQRSPARCRPRSRPSPPVRSRTLRRGAPVRPCSTRSSPPPSSAGQARRTWDTVVVPYAPVGPVRERLDLLRTRLGAEGVALVTVRRRWDGRAWPQRHGGSSRSESGSRGWSGVGSQRRFGELGGRLSLGLEARVWPARSRRPRAGGLPPLSWPVNEPP